RIVPTGLQHQTVTAVPVPGAPGVEITTFRGPNMRPEGGVDSAETIEEDLQYRDFTINALAFEVATHRLVDVVGGRADIEQRLVRAVGDPSARFREDPLRVLRMIRFGCREGFSLDPTTREAARPFVHALPAIAIERVRDEFSKTLLSDRPDWGIRTLQALGLLQPILPEIAAADGFEQNRFHPDDLLTHTLVVLLKTRPELTLRLAALLHDVGKPASLSVDDQGDRHFYRHESIGSDMAREILERLRYPHAVTDAVCTLVRTHMRPLEAGPGGLRRLLRDTEELFPLWRELKEADASSVKIEPAKLAEDLERFDLAMAEVLKGPDVSPLKNLAVNGHDLIGLGLTPGPRFGEILRALHERVLDTPELNEKATLLRMIKDEYLVEDENL
ncbi:MAG: CCA tRNA nucleotidyltransferase, partial [Bdellovibrionales bacterium]|nr:CCA tRNA nucleotidyltransferase [Bdellovibrionales bacterium]